MKKMNIGDYVLVSDIPDQETLDRIRECAKKMGYRVSEDYGRNLYECYMWRQLKLDSDGDLVFSNVEGGNRYTPQEIFAMVEGDDIKQTIERMKQEIATLEKQLDRQITYKCGDRFYIDGDETCEYILAVVDIDDNNTAKCCLISLDAGYLWHYPKTVRNFMSITKDEMWSLTGGDYFRLIEKS